MRLSFKASHPIAAFLVLVLAACGGSPPPSTSSTLSGVVVAETASPCTVSLKDSSLPAQERSTTADERGAYSVDVSGLTPPFVLKAAADPSSAMYAIAAKSGAADISPLSTAAVAGASSGESADEEYSGGEHHRAAGRAGAVMETLRVKLAPLFDHYGVRFGGDDEDGSAALRAMLREVSFKIDGGVLTVTSKATRGIIFQAPLAHLGSGVFHAENIPGSATPPPPPPPTPAVACTYTTGAWAACQQIGTQSRTVTASPAGCTPGAAPAASQACTYVPPPVACTYSPGAWSACQPNGTQTRTVNASPANCQGTAPASSQSCSYVPPACVYTYSAWSTCSSGGTQTRTVASTTPAGCSGTPGTLSQACTPAIDGAALYTQYCTGCHGNGKKGSSANAIQGAINGDAGGMSSLSWLTPAQIQAISAAR